MWYTWQTDGWSACIHVLVTGSLFVHEEILHCQFPVLHGIQSAPVTNTKYQTQDKVQQTSASLSLEWMLVNTAMKTKQKKSERGISLW